MFVRSVYFFFCKQKTAYEMRISDWSSDVCSSDLKAAAGDGAIDVILLAPVGHVERLVDDQTKRRAGEIDRLIAAVHLDLAGAGLQPDASDGILAADGGIGAALRVDRLFEIGKASCGERVGQYV